MLLQLLFGVAATLFAVGTSRTVVGPLMNVSLPSGASVPLAVHHPRGAIFHVFQTGPCTGVMVGSGMESDLSIIDIDLCLNTTSTPRKGPRSGYAYSVPSNTNVTTVYVMSGGTMAAVDVATGNTTFGVRVFTDEEMDLLDLAEGTIWSACYDAPRNVYYGFAQTEPNVKCVREQRCAYFWTIDLTAQKLVSRITVANINESIYVDSMVCLGAGDLLLLGENGAARLSAPSGLVTPVASFTGGFFGGSINALVLNAEAVYFKVQTRMEAVSVAVINPKTGAIAYSPPSSPLGGILSWSWWV